MIDQHRSDSRNSRRTLAVDASGPNYYELLDVSVQSTRLQIRESYIRLRSTYASGSQALYSLLSDEEARHTLDSIEEAYRVLDDERLRKEYDDLIGVVREAARLPSTEFSSPFFTEGQARTSNRFTGPGDKHGHDDDQDRAASVWGGDTTESARSRSASPAPILGKIRKCANRAFDQDIKAHEERLMSHPESFDGCLLTQFRELMDVPQSEIQERTKIAIEYIKALENNDFHKLPSLVYVRGFLKIYLQYLGVQDGKALIDAYSEKYNTWREKHRPHS